jgi:hypothetical protein
MAVRRRSVLRSPKRRRLKSRENTITTSVIVPIALHERAMLCAVRLHWTLGELMRQALTEWLDRHERETKGVSR